MSKIKVLVVPSDRSGVGKFRSVDPHIFLQNQYPDEFHVDIIYDTPYDDINFWTQYQIVAFHRSIGPDFDRAIQTSIPFSASAISPVLFPGLVLTQKSHL